MATDEFTNEDADNATATPPVPPPPPTDCTTNPGDCSPNVVTDDDVFVDNVPAPEQAELEAEAEPD